MECGVKWEAGVFGGSMGGHHKLGMDSSARQGEGRGAVPGKGRGGSGKGRGSARQEVKGGSARQGRAIWNRARGQCQAR